MGDGLVGVREGDERGEASGLRPGLRGLDPLGPGGHRLNHRLKSVLTI